MSLYAYLYIYIHILYIYIINVFSVFLFILFLLFFSFDRPTHTCSSRTMSAPEGDHMSTNTIYTSNMCRFVVFIRYFGIYWRKVTYIYIYTFLFSYNMYKSYMEHTLDGISSGTPTVSVIYILYINIKLHKLI